MILMKETLKNLKRVYYYGKEYKKNMIIFSLMSLSFIIINIIYPILSAKIIVYLTDSLFDQLIGAAALLFGMDLLFAMNRWVLRRNTQVFFRGTTKNIQMVVSKEVLKIELEDIDKNSSGTFIQRINSDTDEMSKIFTRGMGYLTGILTDIGIFVAVFIINPLIFVFYFISASILTAVHLIRVRKIQELDSRYRCQRERTSGLIGELVRGIRDIKMLNAKDSFLVEIEDNIDDLTKSQFKLRNKEMDYSLIIAAIHSVIDFLIIFILVFMLKEKTIVVASALVLWNYKDRVLTNLIRNVGDLLTEIEGFNLSTNRVFSILDGTEFRKEKFGVKKLKNVNGSFEFKDVCFSYGENEVLKNLSFKVNENDVVGIVGKSGAGKTTIFSLLCKLYNVNSGEILLDNVNIEELDEYSIRNNITIISQSPYIFNMSIQDNLKLVKSDLTDEEMKHACKMACLDEFIESLPNKYETIVGEGGMTLSGGQRQRLAIARAFIQDTKIILFDEATSALDNETQSSIQQAINNLKDKYTIVIIAHRLSTIINCDKIMMIEDGKVICEGTHKQLVCNNKKYRKLYKEELTEK